MRDYSHSAFAGKPFQQGLARESALREGLREFGAKYGIKFRDPLHIDTNGEFSLAVVHPDPESEKQGYCGEFGAAAEIIGKYSPRCGIVAMSSMDARNGWCRMNHFSVQRMLEENLD